MQSFLVQIQCGFAEQCRRWVFPHSCVTFDPLHASSEEPRKPVNDKDYSGGIACTVRHVDKLWSYDRWVIM